MSRREEEDEEKPHPRRANLFAEPKRRKMRQRPDQVLVGFIDSPASPSPPVCRSLQHVISTPAFTAVVLHVSVDSLLFFSHFQFFAERRLSAAEPRRLSQRNRKTTKQMNPHTGHLKGHLVFVEALSQPLPCSSSTSP